MVLEVAVVRLDADFVLEVGGRMSDYIWLGILAIVVVEGSLGVVEGVVVMVGVVVACEG